MNLSVPELCARLSAIIYLPEAEFIDEVARLGAHSLRFAEIENHVGGVVEAGDHRYLVFRGTDDRRDWRDNLNTMWVASPYGHVHRGFHRALELLWPRLAPALLDRPGHATYITGHSLGGAIATLAAVRLEEAGMCTGVITFGQPAVGNLWFTRTYRRRIGTRHLRLAHCMDAVPSAPVLAHHVGRYIYFDARERLHDGPSVFRCFADAVHRGWHVGGFPQLRDHGMTCYATVVAKHAATLADLMHAS